MPAPAPSPIVFDLGGVVVRICRTWAEACVRAGIPLREGHQFDDVELIQKRNALADAYMSGGIGCAEFFQGVAEATGGLYTPDEVRAIHDVWVTGDEPGIAELIERLNGADHLVTACLSNTNHSHWQALLSGPGRSPAIALLRRRLVSHELGHVKPDEAIYLAAERALDVPGERILFFDDLEANVVAARERGWRAELIDHSRPTVPQLERHLADLGVLRDASGGAATRV